MTSHKLLKDIGVEPSAMSSALIFWRPVPKKIRAPESRPA
jgi:hypothetical protein